MHVHLKKHGRPTYTLGWPKYDSCGTCGYFGVMIEAAPENFYVWGRGVLLGVALK